MAEIKYQHDYCQISYRAASGGISIMKRTFTPSNMPFAFSHASYSDLLEGLQEFKELKVDNSRRALLEHFPDTVFPFEPLVVTVGSRINYEDESKEAENRQVHLVFGHPVSRDEIEEKFGSQAKDIKARDQIIYDAQADEKAFYVDFDDTKNDLFIKTYPYQLDDWNLNKTMVRRMSLCVVPDGDEVKIIHPDYFYKTWEDGIWVKTGWTIEGKIANGNLNL